MMISDTETRVMTTETRVMITDVIHVTAPAPATQLTRTFRMVTIKLVDMSQVIPGLLKIMERQFLMIPITTIDLAKMLEPMTANITVYQGIKAIIPRKRIRRMKTPMIGGRTF